MITLIRSLLDRISTECGIWIDVIEHSPKRPTVASCRYRASPTESSTKSPPRVLAMMVMAASVAGCAVVYTEADGTKHIIGLANVEIRPPADPRTIAGEVVDTTVIGLGIYNTEAQGGFVLGYGRDVTAAIRDNALVIGNPLQAIQPSPTSDVVGDASSGENKK
jgi:hypothetical protein